MAYPAKFGAYTELFAGLHPDVTVEKSGMFSKLHVLITYSPSCRLVSF